MKGKLSVLNYIWLRLKTVMPLATVKRPSDLNLLRIRPSSHDLECYNWELAQEDPNPGKHLSIRGSTRKAAIMYVASQGTSVKTIIEPCDWVHTFTIYSHYISCLPRDGLVTILRKWPASKGSMSLAWIQMTQCKPKSVHGRRIYIP